MNVRVQVLGTEISATTEVKVAHRYLFNLSVLLVVGPSKEKFKISKDAAGVSRIKKSTDQVPLGAFLGIQFYPFAGLQFRPEFKSDFCRGRFFERKLQKAFDRLGIVAATSVSDLGDAAYLGLTFEVLQGVQVGAGWQPRREQELQDGYKPNDIFMGDDAPTDKKWALATWGAALSIDTDLIRSFGD